MATAAIYTRQSLDRTGEEAGVSRQLTECQALAARLSLSVSHELSDNDISATTGKVRPAFQQLTQLIEAGAIDTVVVWHPDRLYRVLRDLVPLMELATKRGLSIVSVTAGDMDLSSAHGRMLAGILGSVSANEGEHKSERQKLAYKTRAAQGHWGFSRRPFGYERAADGSVQQVPAEAAIVREMYVQHFEQGASRYALVRDLNDRGVLTPTGKPWNTDQVRQVLGNPGYGGYISYRGEVVGTGLHSPIVEAETWDRYQSGATRPVSNFRRGATSLVSGLATCGVCGGRIYRKSKVAAGTWEYRCADNFCVSLGAEKVDEAVRSEVITALLLGPSDLVPTDPSGASLTALTEALASIEQRRDGLLDLVGEGLASSTKVRPQLEALKAEQTELTRQRDDLSRSSVAAEVLLGIRAELFAGQSVSMDKAVGLRKALGERFDQLTLSRQRDLVALLLDIRLHKGRGIKRLAMTHRIVTSLNETEEIN